MNFDLIKGYVLTAASLAVLAAAGVLVLVNSGNVGTFHAYTRSIEGFNIATLMLLSAVGGIVSAGMFWLLIRGVRRISAGYRRKAAGDVDNAKKP